MGVYGNILLNEAKNNTKKSMKTKVNVLENIEYNGIICPLVYSLTKDNKYTVIISELLINGYYIVSVVDPKNKVKNPDGSYSYFIALNKAYDNGDDAYEKIIHIAGKLLTKDSSSKYFKNHIPQEHNKNGNHSLTLEEINILTSFIEFIWTDKYLKD